MQQTVKKVTIILIILAISISLYIDYLYFEAKDKQEFKYHRFLSDLSYNVRDSLETVNYILEENSLEDKLLEKEMTKLSNYINEIDLLINERFFYLEGVSYNVRFFPLAYQVMNDGYSNNGVIISPFLDDRKLDKAEKAVLIELKKTLTEMNEKLHSEENGEVVYDISKYVLTHEIIRSGSYHNLLETYIENLSF